MFIDTGSDCELRGTNIGIADLMSCNTKAAEIIIIALSGVNQKFQAMELIFKYSERLLDSYAGLAMGFVVFDLMR